MSTEQLTHNDHKKHRKMIAGVLLSGLDMEEVIANGVYKDYLDRKNWPEHLKDDVFEEICTYLRTLIDDTARHKNIITHLMQKMDRSDE